MNSEDVDAREVPNLTEIIRKLSLSDESYDTVFSPLFVGVSGGSASGKSTLCTNIAKELGSECTIVSLDSYYKGLLNPELVKDYNFDHPNSLDFDSAFECLLSLKDRQITDIPIYNFKTHKREEHTEKAKPTDIVLFEGILALYDERIRNLMNFKIFVHCDDDIRLCRRIKRDVVERGRSVEGILYQYNRFVKRSYDEYVRPTMNYADIIVPGSRPNEVSIKFVVQNLKNQLVSISRLKNYFRNNLVYQADIFEHLLVRPVQDPRTINEKEIDIYLNKQLIFETDEIEKNLLRNLFKTLLSTFKLGIYHNLIKTYIKHSIKILEKSLQANQINISQLEIINNDVVFSGTYNNSQENYALLLCPYIFFENSERTYEIVTTLLKNQNYKFIFILNVFANMKHLARLAENSIKIKIVNLFCICNFDKLKSTLSENCLDSKQILDPNCFYQKYLKTLIKYKSKLVKLANKKQKIKN